MKQTGSRFGEKNYRVESIDALTYRPTHFN